MRKERRIRTLRRFVLGLAIAAVIVPAAQARVDEPGAGATGSNAGSTVLQGDDKVILPGGGDSTVLIHGDDKVIAPRGGDSTVLIHGDDKVIVPRGGDSTVLIHGDDKVIAPGGDPTAVPVAEPSSPSTFDWSDAFVGAGVAFALMLLAGGAALSTRRHQRPTAA
jgi:hypothetical protein